MTQKMTHRVGTQAQKAFAAALMVAVFAAAGCKSNPSIPASNAGQDQSASSGAPAPATAPASGSNSQPASNQAIAPGPAPVQPAPPPPPPTPPPLTAPVGTRVTVRTNEALSAGHNDVGDRFSGELAQPIVSRGAIVFPRGTRVEGTVVAAKRRGRFKGAGDLGIEINSIGGVHVQTSEYEQEQKGKGKRTGGLIGGGAGLGAIIGGLAGGGKGAVIGGLAGAGAGTAGAAYTGNKDVVIPSESLVSFSLTASLTVQRHPTQ